MRLYWYKSTNFGDKLSPYLVEKITGKKPQRASFITTFLGLKENYSAIGSLFSFIGSKTTVWGTGIIGTKQLIRKPKKILAVRGPLTRQELIKRNIPCPRIYGDPALLLPKYYTPKSNKKYELGIIPHFIDYLIVKYKVKDNRIKIIDLRKPIETVIEDIHSCKRIISSSLHGLIVAHAYKIPALWAEFSKMVIGKGFKFRDYLASVKLKQKPLNFRKRIPDFDYMLKLFDNKNFKINIDLTKLEKACPFKKIK